MGEQAQLARDVESPPLLPPSPLPAASRPPTSPLPARPTPPSGPRAAQADATEAFLTKASPMRGGSPLQAADALKRSILNSANRPNRGLKAAPGCRRSVGGTPLKAGTAAAPAAAAPDTAGMGRSLAMALDKMLPAADLPAHGLEELSEGSPSWSP